MNKQPKKRQSGINAPRLSWPQYLRKDKKGLSDDYKQFTEELNLCQGLVTIAQTVLNRPDLELIMGGPRTKPPVKRPETDGVRIFIPTLHPRRVQCTKHELAHIYFKSDLELRFVFAKKMLRDIEQSSGRKLSKSTWNKLLDCICFIVNIFDDVRVNSLWGLLYPGDGEDFDAWYYEEVGPRLKEKAVAKFGEDISHLFTYMILISLGQEVKSSKWGVFQEDIEEATHSVHYKAFGASLLITKDLIHRIAEKVLEDLPEEKPSWGEKKEDRAASTDVDKILDQREKEGLARALEEMAKGDLPEGFDDDNAGFDFKDRPEDNPEKLRRATAALRALESGEDLEDLLSRQEAAGMNLVEGLKRSMDKVSLRRDDEDHLGRLDKVQKNFIRVPSKDLRPTVLETHELEAAREWKNYFQRVMGVLAMETDLAGNNMQVDLYIQQEIMCRPFDCFTVETSGRGFRLVVLVDMSGSMIYRFHQVEVLVAVLQRALDFPFAHIEVIGFNSTDGKAADIYLYPPKPVGLVSPVSTTGGLTPLPAAINVAGQRLTGSSDENHVFLVSDGFPFQLDRRGVPVNKIALMDLTGDAVKALDRRGTQTWCFMVGDGVPGNDQMDHMFGEGKWRKIREDRLFEDSFDFILRRFLRFIRTR